MNSIPAVTVAYVSRSKITSAVCALQAILGSYVKVSGYTGVHMLRAMAIGYTGVIMSRVLYCVTYKDHWLNRCQMFTLVAVVV